MSSPSPALDALAVIGGTKSLALLERLSLSVWEDWGAGKITDAQAQSLAESIEARRRELRGVDTVAVRAPKIAAEGRARGLSHFPPKRRSSRSLDRQASIERRRTLAASGPMPPQLACHFTTGELAALRVVADEVRDRKQCSRTIGEIAARAGVCMTTARNALRMAARLGLVTIQERRRDRLPNLPNVIRIVSREWTLWIERGRVKKPSTSFQRGGCKKTESTDKGSYRTISGDRALRGQHGLFQKKRLFEGIEVA
jgi:hypothetical protein